MVRVVCLVLLAVLTNCGELCDSSPNCIGSPAGNFDSEKVNLALTGAVTERQQDGSNIIVHTLDSAIVNFSSASRTITQFYHWTPFEESEEITSIDLYAGETLISIPTDNFVFMEEGVLLNAGGYLIYSEKEDDAYSLFFDRASQDFIDGICNDVITNC